MLAALEWQVAQSRRCANGHDLGETMGPDQFDKWNAEVAGTCDICRALDRAERIAAGNDDLDPLSGMQFRVWRDKEEAADGRVD